MKRRAITLLFILALSASASATDHFQRDFIATSALRGETDLGALEYSVETIPYENLPESAKNIARWIGTDGGVPEFVVRSIRIRIGKRKVSLPEAAFRDLANPILPSGLEASVKDGDLIIKLSGGHEDNLYRAEFTVRGGRALERKLYLLGVPDAPPEVLQLPPSSKGP
ncbi:MAG: hypothetical protein JO317_06505 [Verrucomicrobiae bacterium]|nr:hypothetical protein [Verrucomicrobiae bacterium]